MLIYKNINRFLHPRLVCGDRRRDHSLGKVCKANPKSLKVPKVRYLLFLPLALSKWRLSAAGKASFDDPAFSKHATPLPEDPQQRLHQDEIIAIHKVLDLIRNQPSQTGYFLWRHQSRS